MKLALKKILVPIGLLMGISTLVIPTSILLSSCSNDKDSNQDSIVLQTNQQFLDNEKKYLNPEYSFPIYDSNSKSGIQNSIQNLYDNTQSAINALNKIDLSNLDINEKIWLESYKVQWDIKAKNIENGFMLLGSDPITGQRLLSSRENTLSNNIKDAINIYKLNPETGDPSDEVDLELVSSINSRIDNLNNYIIYLLAYLREGMNAKVIPSNLIKKSFIKQTVQFYYSSEIENALSQQDSIELTSIFSDNGVVHNHIVYFDNFLNNYKQIASENNIINNDIDSKIQLLVKNLNEFMLFYCGEYYEADGSYGGLSSPISLSKNQQSIPEIEQTLLISINGETTNIYGLGFSEEDTLRNNIGIGYMAPNPNIKNIKGVPYVGNDIYQQMLYNNNSTKRSAEEIYKQGLQLTQEGTKKMQQIATFVIQDILKQDVNNFDPTIWYTNDPFGSKPTQKKLSEIAGTDSGFFKRFNIWLNQEDFFFGREKLIDVEAFINQYWLNIQDEQLLKYKNTIITQGYQIPWENKQYIDGSEATVSGNQALAGAVLSLESYMQFKESTQSVYDDNFNPIKDYVLSPYNYSIREDIGVGMEGPRGSCQFQYNCDPYYSIQKWSVASLTTHEGAMGHHTQQEYWTEYMPGTKDGKVINSNITPGYSFKNDAYHEGWAVFTEWFAAELGIYGTWNGNDYDGNVLPTNWLENNSTILNIKNPQQPTNDEINFIKNYQGGVYWNIVDQVDAYTTDAEKAVAATKLANMLAYYGFLNESQLRNMRMALDAAVHYNPNGNSFFEANNTALPFGSSLADERNYMLANSGLGLGDITSESIRYMSIPSQATGYMLGKIIFQELYEGFKTHKIAENKDNPNYKFIEDKSSIKQLFNLMLMNGEIPLDVLVETINNQLINNKI